MKKIHKKIIGYSILAILGLIWYGVKIQHDGFGAATFVVIVDLAVIGLIILAIELITGEEEKEEEED